jgi:hypothetical protein
VALKDTVTVTLQVALDSDPSDETPTWTTIASNTTTKLRSWQIKRGRNDTLDTFQAGTASFVLDNRDRRFDPLIAGGPYYGKLKPGKRVRLVVRYGGVDYTRFDGYVDGWPQTYPSPTVKDALVELRATDGFKRLARLRLSSVWRQEVLADAPEAWWRLGESSGTTASDSSGNAHHGTYEGGATFNSRAGLVAYDDDNAIGFDGVDDGVAVPAFPMPSSFTIEAWMQIPSGLSDVQRPLLWFKSSTGGNKSLTVDFTVNDPAFGFRFLVSGGGSGAFQYLDRLADDGSPHHFVLAYDAATGEARITFDGVASGGVAVAVAGIALGTGNLYIGLRPEFDSTPGLIVDEVAIYGSVLATDRIAAHYAAATAPWEGDTPGDRAGKVLDEIGWPAADRDLAVGSASLVAADLSGDPLSHMQDVATSEGGRLFVSRDGKFTLVGRSEFWTESVYTTSQATFSDDGAGLPYTGFGWDYSDSKVRNDVRINPQNGSTQTAADAASQDEYGLLGYSQGSLETSPAKVQSQANWLLQRHKDAAFEVDHIDIDPLRAPSTVLPVVLAAELGYRYTVKRTPQGVGSAISEEVHLEGTSESGDSNSYRFTWQLSRAEPAVFIIGTSTIGGSARIAY